MLSMLGEHPSVCFTSVNVVNIRAGEYIKIAFFFFDVKKVRASEVICRCHDVNPRRHRGVDATPSGFPRITRERIGRSSRNLGIPNH